MKARDIILVERHLNKKEYKAVLADKGIRIGFECEMLLPDEGGRSAVDVADLKWDDLKEYLEIPSQKQHKITIRYENYVTDELRRAWISDCESFTRKWCKINEIENTKGISEPNFIDQHKDAAHKDWKAVEGVEIKEENDMDTFLSNDFSSIMDFIEVFDLDPKFGWTHSGLIHTEECDAHFTIRKKAALQLKRYLNVPIKVFSEYHENDKRPNFWYVEPDESLTKREDVVDAEVVSSVYPLTIGIAKLEKLFEWINVYAATDDTTGLHINLSIKDKTVEDYDFLKIMVFHDENYIAAMFSRLGNQYCMQMRDKLYALIKEYGPTKSTDVFSIMKNRDIASILKVFHSLGAKLRGVVEAHSSIYLRDNGVFEFRSMGGSGYQTRPKEITNHIIHMASLLHIGSDHNALTEEYITKVFALLDSNKFQDVLLRPKNFTRHTIPFSLNSFGHLFQQHPRYIELSYKKPLTFVANLGGYLVERQKDDHLTSRQLRQIRFYVTKNKIKPDNFLVACEHNTDIFNAIASIMKWPVLIASDPEQETLPFVKPAPNKSPTVAKPEPQHPVWNQKSLPAKGISDFSRANGNGEPHDVEKAYADFLATRDHSSK